jgi:phosphoglycerate kinase
MAKLFIEDLDLAGRRVLMRVDFNVPVKNGKVENDKRLRASLPSIRYVLDKGASLVLLENLRFHIEEEGKVKKDDGTSVKADPGAVKDFRASLTRLGDVYVNDAFGTAHRAHSSMAGVSHAQRAAGYLMKKELDFLGDAVNAPQRPFVAIIGGAKVSGKIDVISSLLPKVDRLLIGGAMAFTFYKAQGREVGRSLVEDDRLQMAKDLLAAAGDKLVLPVDAVVTDSFDFDARKVGALRTVASDRIGPADIGVDIGEGSRAQFAAIVKDAKTVVWNGPMGVFEIAATAAGTLAVAQALAEATAHGAITVVGGGDSVAAVEKNGLADKVTHVSTGGGASLEFLEGKDLPGVAYLSDR